MPTTTPGPLQPAPIEVPQVLQVLLAPRLLQPVVSQLVQLVSRLLQPVVPGHLSTA